MPRILVVDDEMIVCESCKRILEEEGYEVEAALSGKEALEKMKAHPFDIVITDLKMPGIDGMELLGIFHKEYPDSIIIMITGFSTVETAVEAMKLGAFDYIPKPFTPDEVTIVVKKAIEKKSLMLENVYLRQELQEKYGDPFQGGGVHVGGAGAGPALGADPRPVDQDQGAARGQPTQHGHRGLAL